MESAKARRKILLDFMSQLDGKKVNCLTCEGTCCTSLANSMRVTPLEALDILNYLHESNRHNDDLKEKLKKCISDYRLDVEISTSRGRPFRKTYTCPFFVPGPKGCSLPKEVNPYGCLGFNPQIQGVTSGGKCHLDEDIAGAREEKFRAIEGLENIKLKEKYNLDWDKLTIPQALLSLWSEVGV